MLFFFRKYWYIKPDTSSEKELERGRGETGERNNPPAAGDLTQPP